MSNHLIHTLIFTLAMGCYTLGFSNDSFESEWDNNSFTSLDFGNEIQQDTTPKRSHSRTKENYRVNKDGEKIHLVVIDGEIKKLKINGKKISSSEYDQYAELVQELREDVDVPTPPTPPTPNISIPTPPVPPMSIDAPNAPSESIHDGIVQALLADGLIDNEEKYKFHLSKKKLKVNGEKQEESVHQKYVDLYEELSGTKMHGGTNYRIHKNIF